MPVSQADVERWKAFGGSMKDTNGRKSFTDPSGKRLKTWKEAERLMDGDAKMVDVGVLLVAPCGWFPNPHLGMSTGEFAVVYVSQQYMFPKPNIYVHPYVNSSILD